MPRLGPDSVMAGQGHGDWDGWDVSMQVGVRIRPMEGNQGQTQPVVAEQGYGHRDRPRP